MIKMIALDLDNTLLNSQKKISTVNEKILKQLHQAGVKVVLCTGRPINAIRDYLDQLELNQPDDYTITFNGGLVINNQTKEPLFSLGMTKADLQPVYDYLKVNQLPMDVLDFERVYELTELGPSRYRQTVQGIEFVDTTMDALPNGNHVFAKAVLATAPAKVTVVKEKIQLPAHIRVVQSQPHILEFLPAKVNKMLGLNHLLSKLGMQVENLMTFGDADNDLEMIAGAGDGVVMANGLPEVKAVANHLTASNDEDGVALYLKKTFDINL